MNLLKKLKRDERAVTGIVVVLVVGLITIGIILPVGLMVTGSLYTTISDLNLGTSGNATRTTLFNNIYAAYNLSVIVPIISAAGLIIGVIGAYFAFRKQ